MAHFAMEPIIFYAVPDENVKFIFWRTFTIKLTTTKKNGIEAHIRVIGQYVLFARGTELNIENVKT